MLTQPANNPVGGTFDKIDVINDAYSQLRISGLTVNPSPEDLDVALDRHECMAAEWFERGIDCGYNFEDTPDPNSPTNVKRGFKQAFATNLAVRLIPDFNKQPPPTLMFQARQSLSNLSARSAYNRLKRVAYPSRQPRGSGNTLHSNRWQRYYSGAGDSGSARINYLYIGDIEDYTEHFDAYLNDGETISSFTTDTDSGISIQSSSINGDDIDYQVKGVGVNDSTSQGRRLIIVATTSAGRVSTRVIYFNISSRPGSN